MINFLAFCFVVCNCFTGLHSETMVKNWPDAIKCGLRSYTPNFQLIFFLHAAASNGAGYYRNIYPTTDRLIGFHPNGSFSFRAGEDHVTKGCDGKSITELYENNEAFNLVHSKTTSNDDKSTMVKGWPDAIRCGVADNGAISGSGAVFLLHTVDLFSNCRCACYTQVYSGEHRYIVFNLDGSFKSRSGHEDSTLGCDKKSIKYLYDNQRAFNLVHSTSYSKSIQNTMIRNWPDAIRCSIDDEGGVIFFMHGVNYGNGGKTVYVNIYNADYRYITFDENGNQKYISILADFSRGCLGKTIEELYESGRAFNFRD